MRYTAVIIAAAMAGARAAPHPAPQGVTAVISPSSAAPSGCSVSYSGSFGVAVMNVTGSAAAAAAPASQTADGQPQAATGSASVAPVSQISDAQPQASTGQPTVSVAPVSQISDAQPQASTGQPKVSVAPVSQISDGQAQAPTKTMLPVSQIGDGQAQAPSSTAVAVSQISDGQPQAATTTAAPVSQISDGQPQASTASAVSQISDAQPQAGTATGGAASPASTRGSVQMVACASSNTLALTLNNGVLLDNKGRTGYIASNQQFQFDNPPQAGAIYTAGFSVCSNGSLALGGSSIFYQCLSGSFFNLYATSQGGQCNPVTINALKLQSC